MRLERVTYDHTFTGDKDNHRGEQGVRECKAVALCITDNLVSRVHDEWSGEAFLSIDSEWRLETKRA